MGLLSNRRRVLGGLPYDYEVEYLQIDESTGALQIDPDIFISGLDYELEMNVCFDNIHEDALSNPYLYNTINNNDALYYIARNGGNRTVLFGAANSPSYIIDSLPFERNKFIKIHVIGNIFYIDGIQYKGNRIDKIKLPESKLLLFVPYKDGIYFYLKIKSFKFTKGTKLVRDMIPVVRNGIGYMYDKVSNKLFGAQGGGEFIVGQKIK